MKHILFIFTLSLAIAMPAFASKELAAKNACMGCHAIDSKLVGPSFKDIANRYAKDKDALVKVSASIQKGGAGKWGAITMPPFGHLTDADVRTLATWVLGAK
jgi:cytochrome c